MKKILLMLSVFLVFAGIAEAQTPRAKSKKYRKHNSKPTYYYNSDGTLSDKPAGAATSTKRPSAYKGDNVPENDGQKKNEQRNINYNNSSQPLPSSSGK